MDSRSLRHQRRNDEDHLRASHDRSTPPDSYSGNLGPATDAKDISQRLLLLDGLCTLLVVPQVRAFVLENDGVRNLSWLLVAYAPIRLLGVGIVFVLECN